jgi:hypothetical protein
MQFLHFVDLTFFAAVLLCGFLRPSAAKFFPDQDRQDRYTMANFRIEYGFPGSQDNTASTGFDPRFIRVYPRLIFRCVLIFGAVSKCLYQ